MGNFVSVGQLNLTFPDVLWCTCMICTQWCPVQMFFGLMSAVLVGVKYKSDKRDQYLHHGGWLVKLALWLGFCILPFFFPVGLVNAYCEYRCLPFA